MPLELGLFIGAQEYGDAAQQDKRSLVLDAEPYRYQAFCSDIAGQDIRAHGNEHRKGSPRFGGYSPPRWAARRVSLERPRSSRASTSSGRELPSVCRALHVKVKELQFAETRSFVEEWITRHPL
jgi:hypothetical protein